MFTTRLRAIFGCAALMAVGLSLATAARADQNLNCDAYAAAAVAQQNENLALGYGFTGGAWSTDYQGHRAWRPRPEVQMADVTREDRARADWLGLCGQKQAACADYAALAVEQNTMNRRWRCGFTGGRWSDDATGHRAWCLTADVDQASGESKARETALGGCAVKGASDDASLAQANLQNMQQKQQQILQMMRNVSKAMHDAAMSTVREMQEPRLRRVRGSVAHVIVEVSSKSRVGTAHAAPLDLGPRACLAHHLCQSIPNGPAFGFDWYKCQA